MAASRLVTMPLLVAIALLLGPIAALAEAPASQEAPILAFGGGPLGPAVPITTLPTGVDALQPAAAYNSLRQEYLVVWQTEGDGPDSIQAQRLSRAGARVGPAIEISTGTVRQYPDVAYNATADQYLVVWVHNDGSWDHIRARRLSATGALLGPEETLVTAPLYQSRPTAPAVAYAAASERYLVVYSAEFLSYPGGFTIWGLLLKPDATADGSAFAVSHGSSSDSAAGQRQAPDVAYNAARDEFLVVWQQKATDVNAYGRRLSGIGMPLPPPLIEVGNEVGDDIGPRVAAVPSPAGDGRYLVTWERIDGAGEHSVRARQVSGAGTLLTLLEVAATNAVETAPTVAGSESASQFLLAWTRHRSELPLFEAVAGRTCWAEAATMDPAASGGGRHAGGVEVTAGPGGDYVLVYDDATDLVGSQRRIFARLWGNRVYLPLALCRH